MPRFNGSICGRVLGPDRGECLLEPGHKSPWHRDQLALDAWAYLQDARDKINVVNVEPVRAFMRLLRTLGMPVEASLDDDDLRREAWNLVWRGQLKPR